MGFLSSLSTYSALIPYLHAPKRMESHLAIALSWLVVRQALPVQQRSQGWALASNRSLELIDQRALGIVRASASIVVWQWITALLLEEL